MRIKMWNKKSKIKLFVKEFPKKIKQISKTEYFKTLIYFINCLCNSMYNFSASLNSKFVLISKPSISLNL